MDSRFFSFRSAGIIQHSGTAVPYNESTVEHTDSTEKIFKPSDEVIDFSAVKTEEKEVVQNVVDLADAKVIDRENEGIMEFDQEGSKRSKKKKPKIKRVTTIRDYVKKIDGKEEADMDYIDIDDDEPSKRVFNEKELKPETELGEEEKEEDHHELDYIDIDDSEEKRREEEEVSVVLPDDEEGAEAQSAGDDEVKETIDCPHCGDTITIPSKKRPVTLKCKGCGKKGVLRI